MAIIVNDTTPRNQYTASAGQTAFTYSFEIFEVTDIKVYNGASVLTYASSPANGTQYSVSNAGVTGGGVVTLGSGGASNGNIITIIRDIPVKRTTDFPSSGPFNIESLNTDLDKIIAILSERENEISRALQLSDTDSTTTMTLPVTATRASKLLGFDSSGNATVVAKPSSSSITINTGTAGSSASGSVSYSDSTGAIAIVLTIPRGNTGVTGNTGSAGSDGDDGISTKWSTGISFPSSSLANGDLFLFTADVANGLTWKDTNGSTAITAASKGDIAQYQSSGTKWVKQSNIVGATGAQGSQGPQGVQGQTGAAGQDGSGDMSDVVDDTTPQLGGNLDINGKDIITTSNANIDLAPHGTGKVVVKGNTNAGTIIFNCESNSHGQTVKSQPHSATVTNTLTLPAGGDAELVSTVATQTLTNKSIVASQLTGTVALARLSDASTSAKGIASFASADFAVSSGAVTLEAAVPKTDEINVYTKPQRNALIVDNDGSFDQAAGNNFKSTPAGNLALTFTNQADGQSGYVLLINSGGHTLSLHANTKGSATTAATITAAGTYLISYVSDGTNSYITNSVVYA